MNLDYKSHIDPAFHNNSKVWMYQSSRLFTLSEALELEALLKQFTDQWQSHGEAVKGAAYLFFGQFIVLMADESKTTVGGCSTDSSVRMIKDLEQRFSVNLLDRTMLAFIIKDKIQVLPVTQLQYAFDNAYINTDTLYFNNLVQTKSELVDNWIVPLKNSWLIRKLAFTNLNT